MSSRSKKRKLTATAEADLEESKLLEQETKTSEDECAQEAQAGRPSRNRRKSVKLVEAEENVKSPPGEPQRLNVLSLHHEKSGKKDSGDLWTITSAKPKRNCNQKETKADGESQLLHVVNKGKRQQTIKIKPLHKPAIEEDETTGSGKTAAAKSSKKSRQKVPPPVTIQEEATASTKEEGIKLKLILSPKDKGKGISESEASSSSENKQTPSREKTGRLSSKEKQEHVKAKLVFGDQILRLDGDKVSIGQSKKRKRDDAQEEKISNTQDSSKGNKQKKTSQPDNLKTSKSREKSGQESKSTTKVESSSDLTTKSSSKSYPKTPGKSHQSKNESKTKAKTSDDSKKQSSNSSKDKEKKKKSKGDKTAAKFNLLSPEEPIEDLVIDESPKKDKSGKKKKTTSSDSNSSHRSKKHKSKTKSKAKFINTGIKKSGGSIGLDPVTAAHMFGQFDSSTPSQQPVSLDLKGVSVPSLDDESFFMAGSDVTGLTFPSDDTSLLGLTGLGSLGAHGKMKKKSSKKTDKDRKKKLKKMLKKEAKGKGSLNKEKKPLSAYMLWCRHTRRSVVALNPDLDFSGISKMMGTLWQQLPDKEKLAWQSKQRQQSIKHKNVPSLSKQKLRRMGSSGGGSSRGGSRSSRGSPARHFPARTEPIDSAAHLKLLGDSLMLVGDRLQNHVGQVEVHGSLSVLLDSTLCALAPLMSLTRQVPQLNSISKETIGSTLDNIAYIMPGIG